jgi:hypothetical protein
MNHHAASISNSTPGEYPKKVKAGGFRRSETRSMLRRILFSILVVWALVDAALTARDMPTFGLKFYGFFASLILSMLFIAVFYLVWKWIARQLHRKPKAL